MIPHTPEPWKWHPQGEANEYCMLTHDGRWVIAFRQNGELTDERQQANARRIAACVNRLAGFKTDDIENPACDITGHGAMLSKLIYVEMQRDRLLAALNLIETDKDGDGFICREAMEQVREAIAQAEEGAGQ